jgi:fluoride exporter
MKIIISIALAGALGAVLRYAVVSMVGVRFFPFGTLCVNVLGSCLMGMAYVVIVEKALTNPDLKPLLMTGALGAFTTFSAFSLETWDLFEKGEITLALLYILASVILSIGALWFGVSVTRFSLA